MDVQKLYQQKLVSAKEAVKVVKSGDWVDYGWCCNHPYDLDIALAARKDELYDVKLRGGVTMWVPEVAKQKMRQIILPGIPGTALAQTGK